MSLGLVVIVSADCVRIDPFKIGPIALATGVRHVLVVPRPRAYALELAALHFHSERCVLLPHPALAEESPAAPLRAVVCAVVRFAAEHAGKRLLVVGHADSAGSASYNLTLSSRRAYSVERYLAGDQAGWAAHAHEFGDVADAQAVLRWLAVHHAWPCDPGPVDGVLGPRTRAALDGFRRVARAAGDAAGAAGGPLADADWRGFFAAYDRVLARLLGCTREQLAAHRDRLVFTAPRCLACGEHQPRTATKIDGLACADNRRVDLLFFDADEVPDLAAAPPGEDVYRGGHEFTPIEPEPYSMLTLRVAGGDGAPIGGATVTVRVGAVEQTHVSDPEGAVWVLGPAGAEVEVRSVVAPDAALVLASVTPISAE